MDQLGTTPSDRPRPLGPFMIIWTGQACSLLGSQLVQFALIWWLTRTSGSAIVLAYASLVALLPQILVGPFAGALVDRWSRRSVMISADSIVALATLTLVGLFWHGAVQVWQIYLVLFIRSLGSAFHWPAMQASTTLMVPEKHLARVGGLNQALSGIAGIVIPPLGAFAIEMLPMHEVLAIDVGTAFLAIAPLCFISVPQPQRTQVMDPTEPRPSVLADLGVALRFIWGWKALMLFAAIGVAINMLGRAAGALQPILVTAHFGGGVRELGWIDAAVGSGTVLGGLALGLWGGLKRRVVAQLVALALDGVAISVAALAPSDGITIALAALFGMGFLEAIVLGLGGAIGQAIIPPELQGRLFGLLGSLNQALAPVGLMIAGPLADSFGVQFWWLITGGLITALGVGALCVPALVDIEDQAHSPWQMHRV